MITIFSVSDAITLSLRLRYSIGGETLKKQWNSGKFPIPWPAAHHATTKGVNVLCDYLIFWRGKRNYPSIQPNFWAIRRKATRSARNCQNNSCSEIADNIETMADCGRFSKFSEEFVWSIFLQCCFPCFRLVAAQHWRRFFHHGVESRIHLFTFLSIFIVTVHRPVTCQSLTYDEHEFLNNTHC